MPQQLNTLTVDVANIWYFQIKKVKIKMLFPFLITSDKSEIPK